MKALFGRHNPVKMIGVLIMTGIYIKVLITALVIYLFGFRLDPEGVRFHAVVLGIAAFMVMGGVFYEGRRPKGS